MNETPHPTPPAAARGLAIASLVCGLLAFVFSVFLVGAIFGVAGLVLGAAHLRRRQPRNRTAWAGIMFSAIGIGASIGFGLAYYPTVKRQVELARQELHRQDETFAAWKGVPAPNLSLTTLDGQPLTLDALKGRRVVLDFWATWCPPCVMEIPHFIRLRNENSTNDLVIVGISNESVETLKAFVTKKGMNYPVAPVGNLPAPYNEVTAIPTTFFIDRKGLIQDVVIGYHDFEDLTRLALAADFEGASKAPPDTPAITGGSEANKQ